jgi:hypothetical protein
MSLDQQTTCHFDPPIGGEKSRNHFKDFVKLISHCINMTMFAHRDSLENEALTIYRSSLTYYINSKNTIYLKIPVCLVKEL